MKINTNVRYDENEQNILFSHAISARENF